MNYKLCYITVKWGDRDSYYNLMLFSTAKLPNANAYMPAFWDTSCVPTCSQIKFQLVFLFLHTVIPVEVPGADGKPSSTKRQIPRLSSKWLRIYIMELVPSPILSS